MALAVNSGLVFPVLVAGRLTPGPHQPSGRQHSTGGHLLVQNGIDPYAGGVFRHSPLFLALFTTVLPTSRIISSIIWTLCDAVGAWALTEIWRARQRVAQTSRDGLIAAAYLLNPYLFLSTLSLSTSPFENTLALLSFMFAARAPLILLLASNPVSQLASPRPFSRNGRKIIPLMAEFLAYTAVLSLASTLISGGWAWVPQTWGASLTLPDLTPNCGLWWYFFTEMFDHFRPFFLMVFSIHLLIYIAPVCIKFQYDPLYAAFLLFGILGTFKSYPTLADPGLFLSMTAVFPEIFPYLRYPIVTTLLHLHAALLMPLFHHLWLNQGTANANFFYASTLVFACANGAAVADCVWAGLRIAIGPGEGEEGKGKGEEKFVVVQE
ncbi:GPI transamidase subunit PIG-U-domain-containing protein [Mycena olivaceomarginata]|nr:GPI transamidase subunit PIG-U-domain-containing protein [Mycena olivaceomarginata]